MTLRRMYPFVLLLALAPAPPAPVPAVPELPTAFTEHLEEVAGEIVELRRDIHRHPELSGQEERTAALVAGRLEELGLRVRRDVGGTGVVAMLRGGLPGPVVAFRADMDAVRSNDPDPVPFASENEGVRHICGHDIHTTIGVALAEALAAMREQLPGTVMFVFQPAEESASGARAMIESGAFAEVRPEAIYAFHTAPYEVGVVATAPEVMMPARDRIRIGLAGEGDLARVARDLVQAVNGFTTVSSPFASQPADADFILAQARPVGSTATGDVGVAAVVTMATQAAREELRARLAALVADIEARHPQVEIAIEHEERWVAGVTNSPELVAAAEAQARTIVGVDQVQRVGSVIPAFSEDFGSFQEQVPGVMFFLGVSNAERGWVGMPHTPDYVADEEAIFVGARVMGAILLDRLRQDPGAE